LVFAISYLQLKGEYNMELIDYVRAGYPAVVFMTPEEDRAVAECRRIASKNAS